MGGEEVEKVNVLVRLGYVVVKNHPQIQGLTPKICFFLTLCVMGWEGRGETVRHSHLGAQSDGVSIILKVELL